MESSVHFQNIPKWKYVTNQPWLKMMKYLCIPIALVLLLLWFNFPHDHPAPTSAPLPIIAHAHNDYQHDYPLWDALHFGYRSIEVDVP